MPPFTECRRHFVANIRLGTRFPESIRNHIGGVRTRHIGEAVACRVRCDGGNRHHTPMFTSMHSLLPKATTPNSAAKDSDGSSDAKGDVSTLALEASGAVSSAGGVTEDAKRHRRRVKYFPLVDGHCLPQLSHEETPDLILEDEIIPGLTRDFFEGNRERLLRCGTVWYWLDKLSWLCEQLLM